jgi:hypothetical protein
MPPINLTSPRKTAGDYVLAWVPLLFSMMLVLTQWTTWKETKKSSEAALLNARALLNAERAWVMAELDVYGASVAIVETQSRLDGEGPFEVTRVNHVKLTCKNQGRSPAWIEEVYAQVHIVNATTVETEPELKRKHGPMDPLGPGGEKSRSLEFVCRGRRQTPDDFLSIFVVVVYRDIFNQRRETSLGYSLRYDDRLMARQFGIPGRNRNT